MAAVAYTNVGLANASESDKYSFLAGVAIDAGEVVTFDATTGKLILSDASTGAANTIHGIALNNAGVNSPVTILKRGFVDGYAVSALANLAKVYLSDTGGGLDTSAGTVSVIAASVLTYNGKKMLYVDYAW